MKCFHTRFVMVLAKKGFFGETIPVGQLLADIGILRILARMPVQELRIYALSRLWMLDKPFFHVLRGIFVVFVYFLDAHTGEERSESVEVVLRPLLPRVVMTL